MNCTGTNDITMSYNSIQLIAKDIVDNSKVIKPRTHRCCQACKAAKAETSVASRYGTLLSYGLISILFIWNAELTRQVKDFRGEMFVLKRNLRDYRSKDLKEPLYALPKDNINQEADENQHVPLSRSIGRELRPKRSTGEGDRLHPTGLKSRGSSKLQSDAATEPARRAKPFSLSGISSSDDAARQFPSSRRFAAVNSTINADSFAVKNVSIQYSISNEKRRRTRRGSGRKAKRTDQKKGGRRGKSKRGNRRRKTAPRSSELTETTSTKATAIHVQIGGTPVYRGVPLAGNDGVIRQWRTSYGYLPTQGFDASNLNATGNSAGVAVTKTGVYFIYGQVTFDVATDIEFHESIEIVKTDGGSSGLIVETLTSCVNSLARTVVSDTDYVTCHSSGIVRMESGWKFRVRVDPADLNIYNNPRYTYFGGFFIGESAQT